MEINTTPRYYSCHNAMLALAAKKEVLSPGSHPYFKELSLDTAESALAKRQGLENFAFDHVRSQRKGFLQQQQSL